MWDGPPVLICTVCGCTPVDMPKEVVTPRPIGWMCGSSGPHSSRCGGVGLDTLSGPGSALARTLSVGCASNHLPPNTDSCAGLLRHVFSLAGRCQTFPAPMWWGLAQRPHVRGMWGSVLWHVLSIGLGLAISPRHFPLGSSPWVHLAGRGKPSHPRGVPVL